MAESPLTPPPDRSVLDAFLQHFGLPPDGPPLARLCSVVTAFAELPYENLTKIIKADACGSPERARRHPAEVVGDHVAAGAGGTCFSLTAALLHLVRTLGWRAGGTASGRSPLRSQHALRAACLGRRPPAPDRSGILDSEPYLQGRRLQTRSREAVDRQEIAPAELPHRIPAAFGLAPQIVARALAVLHRQGDCHG